MRMFFVIIAAILIVIVVAMAVYAKPKRKIWRILCLLPITALISAIAFFAGALWNELPTASEQAQYALKDTGLTFSETGSFSLHGSYGWRDFYDITEFIIPYPENRQTLLAEMKTTEGWHASDVTYNEYLDFCELSLWADYELIMLPEDTVFEAWYYRETCEPSSFSYNTGKGAFEEIGKLGHGFTFAVYDVDTGLFIYFNQHG